jgi:WD40 repeat protein
MKHSTYFLLFLIFGLSCSTTKSKFVYESVLWSTDWSPNGKLIAVGGNIGKLNLLTSDGLKIQKTFKKLNTITKVKWHPDGQLIAISRQGSDAQDPEDNKAEIINIADGSTITLDVIHARGLGWANNGRMLAIGDGEGMLRIYSKTGYLIKEIQTDQKSITGLSWHPSSGRIVTIGSHIEIIEVGSEKRTKIIPREIEILMLSVEWHPLGEFFVTGDYGDYVLDYPPLLMFWDAKGNKIREVNGSKAEYRNLKWTKNGDRLVTASDKVRIWSKEGKLMKERSLGALLWGIDWNRKNDKIVVTSEDGRIFVLDEELIEPGKLK